MQHITSGNNHPKPPGLVLSMASPFSMSRSFTGTHLDCTLGESIFSNRALSFDMAQLFISSGRCEPPPLGLDT